MPRDNNKGPDIPIRKKQAPPRGVNYLLAIAINDYPHCPKLFNCRRDADNLIELLTEHYRFEESRIIRVYDQKATRAGIYQAFRKLADQVSSKDNLLVYFSGHGLFDTIFGEGAWIPYEAKEGQVHDYLFNSEVKLMLSAIKSHHTFLLVDSCFSGSFFSDAVEKQLGKRYESDPSRWVLTSGRNEIVSDGKPGDNSPFAESLLSSLELNIEPLGVQELCVKVVDEVEQFTEGKQTPIGQPLWLREHKNGQFVFRRKKYAYDLIKLGKGKMEVLLLDGATFEAKPTGHKVAISPFFLAAYPVTFDDFDDFCHAMGFPLPTDNGWGRGRRPVINVRWFDAIAYCNWLSLQHGLQPAYATILDDVRLQPFANGYRLPTELEWEYAAREGGNQIRFGNGQGLLDPDEANFNGEQASPLSPGSEKLFRAKTTPVDQFTPNALGFYDLCGNIWEWCWNRYAKDYDYLDSPTGHFGPLEGGLRVCRGGSWLQPAEFCQVAARYGDQPINSNYEIGFRLARNAD